VALFQPLPGETVSGDVYVAGRANLPEFDHYVVEYGEGQDPLGWGPVAGPVYAPVDGGLLAVWNVRTLADRDYTLRVVVFDRHGGSFEARTWVWVQNPVMTDTPVPTWTPSPTWTPTLAPTETALPTITLTPTWTPTFAPTDTPAPVPTDTPLPTKRPTYTPTPMPTGTPAISVTVAPPTWTPTVTTVVTTSP
jgi:hypothetical protein